MTQEYINIGWASIVTAFDEQTIGTKVLCKMTVLDIVAHVVAETDFETQKEPGQATIELPNTGQSSVLPYVSAGVATSSKDDEPEHFVIRKYREGCKLYLKRSVAVAQGRCPVTECKVVIYTRNAYLADPDVNKPEEAAEKTRIEASDFTHIIVAFLASNGSSPLSVFRFVHNLAGGNNEAAKYTADEIRGMAKEIIEHSNTHISVAD
jgi:hypothetical protein